MYRFLDTYVKDGRSRWTIPPISHANRKIKSSSGQSPAARGTRREAIRFLSPLTPESYDVEISTIQQQDKRHEPRDPSRIKSLRHALIDVVQLKFDSTIAYAMVQARLASSTLFITTACRFFLRNHQHPGILFARKIVNAKSAALRRHYSHFAASITWRHKGHYSSFWIRVFRQTIQRENEGQRTKVRIN